MPVEINHSLEAALRLHRYLVERHWSQDMLIGPDPGIRLNYRVGRFIKSCLPRLPWKDDYYYLQGQGYWVLANWALFQRTGDELYRDIAVIASRSMLRTQREDGAWPYPNIEWKGRVATVEGSWASLGLLETYRHVGEPEFLDGILRWHAFLERDISYQITGDEVAVNYFAYRQGQRVINNSAFVLRFLAELAETTGDSSYAGRCSGLLTFIGRSQKPSGEFPYTVPGTDGGPGQPHFQCYQYNAFQCLDLVKYAEVSGDPAATPVIQNVLRFLGAALNKQGRTQYACGNPYRTVVYHTAVVGLALAQAPRFGVRGLEAVSQQAYRSVLAAQLKDGRFPYSRGDYRLLKDKRSYPRYLAMILLHLLLRDQEAQPAVQTRGAGERVGAGRETCV